MVLAFCFTNFVLKILSVFLAYLAMEYLFYVSMTPFSFWTQLLFPKKKKRCVCVCVWGGGGGGGVPMLGL